MTDPKACSTTSGPMWIGHLTRWRRRDLDEIYLELYPAKVMAEADELDEILAEPKTFITLPRRDRDTRRGK